MTKPVLILGAGSIGKRVVHILNSNDILVYAFLDDDDKLHNTEIDDISVLGSIDDKNLLKITGKKYEIFVAIAENKVRKTIIEMINKTKKIMPINVIHATTILPTTMTIGYGNFINAGVLLSTNVKIKNHCLLHTNVAVAESVTIGDYAQIGMGTNINSEVIVEDEVFIGSGVTIISGIRIGKGARIGAGSVVINHVKENTTYFGNPAKVVK